MTGPFVPKAAALFLAVTAVAARAEQPVLTVLTYDSFVSEWGPGPVVEKAFEAQCGCDLRFLAAGDGAALLARLRLDGGETDTDVVLGLDTSLTAEAAATGLFAPHGLAPPKDLPVPFADPLFHPFDWGWFAFVHDRTRLPDPPASFAELLAREDVSLIVQDPRSSTPGLGLLLWVKRLYGADAGAVWEGLAPRIVTVTKGWSEAYGLFLEGEADMVLSYTTSPAYHAIAEKDATKAAAIFAEGHYLQIEVAGRLAGSDEPVLAQDFLEFLTGPVVQDAIPTTNWMYPATTSPGGLPEEFRALPVPAVSLLVPPDEVPGLRRAAIDEWRAALSR